MEQSHNTWRRRNIPPPLNKEDTKYVQAVAGTLLYYGQMVNNTILPDLSAVAMEQAKPTEKTMATIKQLLDYLQHRKMQSYCIKQAK